MDFITLIILILILFAVLYFFLNPIVNAIFSNEIFSFIYSFYIEFITRTCLGSIIGSFITIGVYWLLWKIFGPICNRIAAVAAGAEYDPNIILKYLKIIPPLGGLVFFLMFGMNACGIWH